MWARNAHRVLQLGMLQLLGKERARQGRVCGPVTTLPCVWGFREPRLPRHPRGENATPGLHHLRTIPPHKRPRGVYLLFAIILCILPPRCSGRDGTCPPQPRSSTLREAGKIIDQDIGIAKHLVERAAVR